MELKLINENREINLGNVKFGEKFIIIAGPCAVESEKQLIATAKFIKSCGAHALRCNVFKPRTSPYSFQGLGEKGLSIVKKVKKKIKMPVVIEVLDPRLVKNVCKVADIIQIGARNMQNFPLLEEVGKISKPVILKRGFASTIYEWLCSAEYILKEGNNKVILCERGVRTFSKETRFTLDISSVPLIKRRSKLPILVDPSHAAGEKDLVIPLAKAAKAVGADGIMVEVHPNPEEALSDHEQQLDFNLFKKLMEELK